MVGVCSVTVRVVKELSMHGRCFERCEVGVTVCMVVCNCVSCGGVVCMMEGCGFCAV